MPQQVRVRPQKTISYNENNRDHEQLSKGMAYRELMLRLRTSIDVGNITSGSGNLANLQAAEEWGLVQRIELIVNGSEVIRSISGEELRWMNFFQYDIPPRVTREFSDAADDSTVVVDSVLLLPFWQPDSLKPIDTLLDATKLSDLKLEITWGDLGDVLKNSTGVSFVSEPTLDIYSLESFGISGPFSQTRISRITETSVAVNDQFQVELPVGQMYRGLLINTKDSDGDDAPNEIGNIKIRSGTNIFFDCPSEVVQQWMKIRLGNQSRSVDGANDTRLPYFLSANSDDRAWYWLDLAYDGYNSEAIDTIGFSELLLEFDVTSVVDNLTIIPLQIIPVRQPNREVSLPR